MPAASARAALNRVLPESRAFIEAEVSRTTTTFRAPSPITVMAGRARARLRATRARICSSMSGSQSLEERGGLAVAEQRLPQQQARHRLLAAPDLQEVQQDDRQGERERRERQGTEKAHDRINPRSWARTNSSADISVVVRR
jgi:hypothetical protein